MDGTTEKVACPLFLEKVACPLFLPLFLRRRSRAASSLSGVSYVAAEKSELRMALKT